MSAFVSLHLLPTRNLYRKRNLSNVAPRMSTSAALNPITNAELGETEYRPFERKILIGIKQKQHFPTVLCGNSIIEGSCSEKQACSELHEIPGTNENLHFQISRCSLSSVSPLKAILFDIDGTLCDSDPIHYYAFREMLQEVGFNGGVPISEEFFIKKISGMHNDQLCHVLFPDWDFERARKFMDDKEAMFRRLASEQLKPLNGLNKLCKWIEDHGLKRAAVTNAPRPNAEMMISQLGLADFFEALIIGSECERAKPFPDPYLKGLQALQVSAENTFIFEDSMSGTKAGVAAGMPVVGVASRNPENLLREAGATFTIQDFEDSTLWTALEELKIG